MRTKEATIIFLLIIVATSVYVGYNYFQTPNISQEGKDDIDPSTEQLTTPLVIATSPAIEEPNSYQEMMIDLENNGLTIINWTGGWHGRRGLSYQDAIILAKKANWVGVEYDSLGFVFWLDGDFWIWYKEVAQSPSGFEKVEIQSAINTWDATGTFWKISMKLRNTGTARASLVSAFVNNAEVQNYGLVAVVLGETSTNMTTTTTINSGERITVIIYIDLGYEYLSSGTTIMIKFHSAGGMDYIKLVELV